ncbi:hypothetical protein [Ferrovibrio sp.]|uniref:hypothetical protein n=1 Tax=Ferrovibrio sp. TaxID=1917215 RepID=UPI003D10563C
MADNIKAFRADGHTEHFTCTDCGQEVWRLCAPMNSPAKCIHCLEFPGWQQNEQLARIFGHG